MSTFTKGQIQLEDGKVVDALEPLIVSASRSTDIPAFYADWFFDRLKKGYSVWVNPFNGVPQYISYAKTKFIVFWSKNPEPLLKHLDYLKERGIGCYIQFTLNDYDREKLEKKVPSVDRRIETFKKLVDKLGKGHVIWRFDPLILANNISMDSLLAKAQYIGDQLKNYTEKMVFSYVDIEIYPKVVRNLHAAGIEYKEWTKDRMMSFADEISRMNRYRKWYFRLATCAEAIDLSELGIEHNRCVDDELIIRFAWQNKELMDFCNAEVHKFANNVTKLKPTDTVININSEYYAVKHKNNKDKGQRKECGCMVSKDIGQYNTCPHQCEYCYANNCKELATANWKQHQENKFGEMIVGDKINKPRDFEIPLQVK